MDYAPLNLAHFHERRAEKFLRKHRYDDAYKAVQTSLLYVQDALKNVTLDKSIEVVNTQKGDYERKLQQILMQKQHYERLKLKEIVPIPESSVILKPIETSLNGQSIAKSIDKTIEKFDYKTNESQCNHLSMQGSRECRVTGYPCNTLESSESTISAKSNTASLSSCGSAEAGLPTISTYKIDRLSTEDIDEEIPSLAPLELPPFDLSLFTNSTSSLASFNCLAENFQK